MRRKAKKPDTPRIWVRGSNNWNYRQGYQNRQRVPAPILPMEEVA